VVAVVTASVNEVRILKSSSGKPFSAIRHDAERPGRHGAWPLLSVAADLSSP
jgi:hypothetical protein